MGAVDAFALRLQADAEEEREEGHGSELEPSDTARAHASWGRGGTPGTAIAGRS